MPSFAYRLALCARCRSQLRLCRRCDRGQRLCASCRPVQRRESLRRAGANYRTKPRARRLQAARQARYRDRQRDKFSVQKVTHHAVTEAAASPTSLVALEITSGRKDHDDDRIRDIGRCSLCGARLPAWAMRERRARLALHLRAPRIPRGPPR